MIHVVKKFSWIFTNSLRRIKATQYFCCWNGLGEKQLFYFSTNTVIIHWHAFQSNVFYLVSIKFKKTFCLKSWLPQKIRSPTNPHDSKDYCHLELDDSAKLFFGRCQLQRNLLSFAFFLGFLKHGKCSSWSYPCLEDNRKNFLLTLIYN